jgi:NAD(P)-dependent dehydrogenase (short-subunit alcohol dehydrogenase family)
MSTRFSLEGKVALVTGAGRGIGRAIAIAYAEAGAHLLIGARTASELDDVAAEIEGNGGKVISRHLDMSQMGSVRDFAAAGLSEYGHINILVNNAGVPMRGTVLQTTEEDWDRVTDINQKGLFFLTQACARPMIEQGGGKIIHVTSTIGIVAMAGQCAYGSGKAAVIHMSKVMAIEWAEHKINVNTIAPFATRTGLGRDLPNYEQMLAERATTIPMGRVLDPDDLEGAALFLASSASDFITGQTLVVDGGYSIQ